MTNTTHQVSKYDAASEITTLVVFTVTGDRVEVTTYAGCAQDLDGPLTECGSRKSRTLGREAARGEYRQLLAQGFER